MQASGPGLGPDRHAGLHSFCRKTAGVSVTEISLGISERFPLEKVTEREP